MSRIALTLPGRSTKRIAARRAGTKDDSFEQDRQSPISSNWFCFYPLLLLGFVAGSYFSGYGVCQKCSSASAAGWNAVGAGELQARDGTPLSFTGYKSRYGVTLTVISGRFSSSDRANAEVYAQMKEAKSIVTEEAQADSRGRVSHQRVVVMIAGDGTTSRNAILWTEDDEFHEIVSSSMTAAIEWEKKLTHMKARDRK